MVATCSFEHVAFLCQQLNDVLELFFTRSFAFVVGASRFSPSIPGARGAIRLADMRCVDARDVAFPACAATVRIAVTPQLASAAG